MRTETAAITTLAEATRTHRRRDPGRLSEATPLHFRVTRLPSRTYFGTRNPR